MIQRLFNAMARNRLRKDAEAHRRAVAIADAEKARWEILNPLQKAIRRGDDRRAGELLPAAQEATHAALRAGRGGSGA